MPQVYSRLRKAALALPEKQRADLSADLIESLYPSSPLSQAEIDKLWEEEIGRRVKAYKQGKSKAMPVSNAIAAARARLKA